MEVKIGRKIFTLTNKDRILDNGTCYQLITQKIYKDWGYTSPVIPKTLFKKLLKEDKIAKTDEKYKGVLGDTTSCVIYAIRE